MRKKTWIAAIVTASMLSAGSAAAASRTKVEEARSRHAQTQNRRVVSLTDRTDSWLCNHVSVFFCTGLFPQLNTGNSNANSAASLVPDRSRKGRP